MLIDSGEQKSFVESPSSWENFGECVDAVQFNLEGIYRWSALILIANVDGKFTTTYTPDGIVRDHEENIVGTHSLFIPAIVIQ